MEHTICLVLSNDADRVYIAAQRESKNGSWWYWVTYRVHNAADDLPYEETIEIARIIASGSQAYLGRSVDEVNKCCICFAEDRITVTELAFPEAGEAWFVSNPKRIFDYLE